MGNFRFVQTGFEGMTLIETVRHADARGYFMETYHAGTFGEAGYGWRFVQDNQAKSRKGVLRGLHYQIKRPQGKLMRVLSGTIFDAAVDMRAGSPTFGRWFGAELSAEKGNQIYVPEGFAHGYLVLSDTAEIFYKCTDFYDPSDEGAVLWNDPALGIEWPELDVPYILSEKDRNNPLFQDRRR